MIFISKWFSNLKRRRAIKRYAKKLGPVLKKRYGKSKHYTQGQIQTAVTKRRLSHNHISYAYAMYMDKPSFNKLHEELGKECDYDSMRNDIGNLCFSGDSNFTSSDAISYSGFTDAVGFSSDADGGD